MDVSNLLDAAALAALLEILAIDIVLAGDNAIVVGALAAGLPAIVTTNVALARDVHAVGAGLVTEPTETGLASALRWAAEHPAALLEMGDRAWQHAYRELSW